MKIFLALLLGIAVGAAAIWFYDNRNAPRVRSAENQIQSTATSAGNAIEDKLKAWHLTGSNIQDDLARGGQVVRRKAQDLGHAVADATADARITAAIKGKLVADRNLSALGISVNTTQGVVTLSGTVSSRDDIGKAMLLAMDTAGVREVISTLQVKPKT
jgi:hyperosmotically inducible periplasmic protein